MQGGEDKKGSLNMRGLIGGFCGEYSEWCGLMYVAQGQSRREEMLLEERSREDCQNNGTEIEVEQPVMTAIALGTL